MSHSLRPIDGPSPQFLKMLDDLSLHSELADAVRGIYLNNFLHFFGVAFLLYDHLITLGNEVNYLWLHPKAQSTYWFFFNRYLAFIGNLVIIVVEQTDLSPDSCRRYILSRQLLLVFNQVLVCILLTLRVYAFYDCSFRILAYMLCSGMTLGGIACWALFGQKSTPGQEIGGCHIGLSHITAIRLASAWEALFVYDSILFSLMMFKTWKNRNQIIFSQAQNTIIYLIFRDGAIYFVVMAFANLANILTFYFCGPFMSGALSTFASGVSVTMVSRLMFNLREKVTDAGIHTTTNIASTPVEFLSPSTEIELDTIWSGDMQHCTIPSVRSLGPVDEDNTNIDLAPS